MPRIRSAWMRRLCGETMIRLTMEPLGESDPYGLAEHLKDSFGTRAAWSVDE